MLIKKKLSDYLRNNFDFKTIFHCFVAYIVDTMEEQTLLYFLK